MGLMSAGLGMGAQAASAAEARSTPWALSTFLDAVDADQIEKVSFAADGKQVLSIDKDGNRHESLVLPGQSAELIKTLQTKNVVFAVQSAPEPNAGAGALGLIANLAFPFLIIGGLLLYQSRQNGGGGGLPGGANNPMNIGKSKSKIQMDPNTGVTFNDVAGCDASKQELTEIVEFLKNPAKYSALGAKIPRGAVMEGPPGTGKTLNQILTQMDGFEGNSGVIVLAATNRADVLDSALLRPGRFDRRVPVDLPDTDGRLAILKVHCRGKPLDDDLDLNMVARRTTGFSGASLANLMNEAAIVAARNDKTVISYNEVDYAIDRLTVGMTKETGTSFPERQRLVAYHEAGHAIMGALTPDYDEVAKVTILPRTNGAGGFTLFAPSEERLSSGMYSKRYLKGQLAVALGGRVVEEIVYGKDEITTGASGDLQQVRNIARRMVAQWGFAQTTNNGVSPIGAIAWESPDGNGGAGPQGASLETEAQIDEQVKLLVAEAYEHCMNTLVENRQLVEELTDLLLEKETVDYKELKAMVAQYNPELATPLNPAMV